MIMVVEFDMTMVISSNLRKIRKRPPAKENVYVLYYQWNDIKHRLLHRFLSNNNPDVIILVE